MRRLVLYEDPHWRSLRPLTDLLPVPALSFGASDLARRWIAHAALPLLSVEARAEVAAAWRSAPARETGSAAGADEVVVVNAAALPGPWFAAALAARAPALWLGDRRIAGARLPLAQLESAIGRGADFETSLLGLGLPAVATDAELLLHPWDLIARNADAIAADLAGAPSVIAGDVHRLACLEAPERIAIERGASVGPFAVLDAREGPIRVAAGARVAAHTVVTGPCVVGAGTQLLGGAVSASTFGPECRIAGEVEASLWQGYANKRHHGFVGHSLVGEWVNLGALTTTSDLKNNYGSVRVWVDGRELDSGSPKLGAIVGGHVKTGIGTLLPTGASVGVGANLFGGGRFAPRHLPAFAWWDGASLGEHELERFLGTARIAFGRRARTFSPADEALARRLFAATAGERRAP
ncbi:MAG TPA: putative sugar nucleotidyl transferase [Candidatus Acidoferrales bacterium]|nr:putative sugar nucleotidyl transferase [Candidatus Acidoferrales bacterium]